MKKTMNINIAGQLFRIDEDALQILTRYLEHVSARFRTEQGGDETVADIETRIAEIFGGGSEPPVLVSKEMVDNMINIMGAPEDYYDDARTSGSDRAYSRKSMYDPNTLSARVGKALSEFFKAVGKIFSAIIRIFAVIFGSIFTILGFLLLFSFVILLFLNNAPFVTSLIEPDIMNTHMLLSIVLGSNMVTTILILAALVILIPLASLTYLGIRMIFRIRERSRVLSIALFVTWIASLCALSVLLSLHLTVYSTNDSIEQKVSLDNPPEVLWIAPMKKVTDIGYDETASVDHFTFWRKSSTGQLFCTPDLNIYGSDTTSGWISVERKAFSNSEDEAWSNARMIEFSWKLSGDTLYLDEYFSLPEGEKWNGSDVEIDVSLPEGTVVRPVQGTSLSKWLFRVHEHDADSFRIEEGAASGITEY